MQRSIFNHSQKIPEDLAGQSDTAETAKMKFQQKQLHLIESIIKLGRTREVRNPSQAATTIIEQWERYNQFANSEPKVTLVIAPWLLECIFEKYAMVKFGNGMSKAYKLENLKLAFDKYTTDAIVELVYTWVYNGVVSVVAATTSLTVARATLSAGLSELLNDSSAYGSRLLREAAHLLAIVSYPALLQTELAKIKSALAIDGATHLTALTNGLDS